MPSPRRASQTDSDELTARAEGVRNESLWTAAEVARYLGVTSDWVYRQSRAGLIPTVHLGRYRRYRREAIERWLAELEPPVITPVPQMGSRTEVPVLRRVGLDARG